MIAPRSIVVIASLLLALPPALADGIAAASITGVRFGVLDLTPADGVVAGFDLRPAQPALYAALYGDTADYYAAGYPDPRHAGNVAIDLGGSLGRGTYAGTLGHVGTYATVDGDLGAFGYANANASQRVDVLLRPHSVLTVEAHLSTLASRSEAPGEFFDIVGMASVSIGDDPGYTYQQHTRQSLAYADLPDEMTIDEDVTLAFANGGAQDMAVHVYFNTWSNVMCTALPIPEPAPAAMLATGLLLLAARRRRAASRSRAR
jgi:hypothetical protein